MDTPRDIAKRHRPGRPMEDELEDAIARHVLDKDKRIAQLEAMLRELLAHDQEMREGRIFTMAEVDPLIQRARAVLERQ